MPRVVIIVCLALFAGTASAQNSAMQRSMMERAFSAQDEASEQLIAPDALRALVCGSASPLGVDPKRQQTCIAVIAGGRIFVVDTGAGSSRSLARAGLPMDRLEAVLLTHFHSDHIGALGDVNLAGWIAGRAGALRVMGPEGVEQVVGGFNDAYALDRKYRTAHHATTGDVAATAAEAGVRMTVLYHLVPAPANPMVLSVFARGLPKDIVVASDGMLFELAMQATSIEQSQVFDP